MESDNGCPVAIPTPQLCKLCKNVDPSAYIVKAPPPNLEGNEKVRGPKSKLHSLMGELASDE